ncbi:MAG: type II toxin-antitoxin system HicB family antitoxin [Candidatus Freyarchaeum deiterrae]
MSFLILLKVVMLQFSAVITKEEKFYVALCPELDIASQAENIEEAIKNLKEAISLYLEDEDAKIPEMD